ncbi:MAG: M13 family metallopeptidase [Chitinophagaceae bacterium]|nr:M13 family metallopeptidase [Chitinophagaceae bacterium]
MKLQTLLALCCLTLGLYSCQNQAGNTKAFTSLPEGVKFIDPSFIDSTVNPGDDFYQFAGGNWMKKNPIPASETRWGSFNLLEDFNKKALKGILEETSAKTGMKKGSPEQMVGDLYASGMDTAAIDKAGIHAIDESLNRIAAIQDVPGLVNEIAHMATMGMNPLFATYVGPDDKNVTNYILNMFQGGLGLPDRDYYLKNDPREKDIREKYLVHMATMLTLSGEPEADAKKHAATIMGIETALAKASMDRVAMRDPYKLYNKFTLAELSAKTPGLDWKSILNTMMISNQDTVLVAQPEFFAALASMLSKTPIEDWKIYLKWHTISQMAGFLSKDFDQEDFNFYGKIMRGQEEQKPRWKRVLGVVDGAVGEQLGKMYTDKYFTAEAKKRMLELVNNLQIAFESRIKQLDWMSDSTKTKALEKLHTFIKKIGYPDKWRDYTGLEIVRENYAKNVLASNVFDYKYNISKLGKPVDKTEWGMTPPTVNAYYNPAFNEIVFPAGILQYPFFDLSVDDAAIYGAIGAVIGHEMTHGFDDQGCQYAADGNLKNWWSAEDKKRFDEKTKMVKEQYDGYTILDGKHVNGALTLGENIADLGGVTIAYEAFKMTKQGKSNEKIDGFTPDQRYFLSWAQVWRQNIRDEEAAQRLVTDVHSPGSHRCNGPLSNFAPFYAAFNVKEGNKMYKPEAERAKVW